MKMSAAAANGWAEALKPQPYWLIEHLASRLAEPYYYTGATPAQPWSVEKARARRFKSSDDAWDYVHEHLMEHLCRVRKHI